ncbi:MAG: hypothetical protein IKQ31_02630 [Clostridia bacterium]|nr:hypothetical protein [Clostridia bacterium]
MNKDNYIPKDVNPDDLNKHKGASLVYPQLVQEWDKYADGQRNKDGTLNEYRYDSVGRVVSTMVILSAKGREKELFDYFSKENELPTEQKEEILANVAYYTKGKAGVDLYRKVYGKSISPEIEGWLSNIEGRNNKFEAELSQQGMQKN